MNAPTGTYQIVSFSQKCAKKIYEKQSGRFGASLPAEVAALTLPAACRSVSW